MHGPTHRLTYSDVLEAQRNARRNPLELMRELMKTQLRLPVKQPLPWLATVLVDHTMPNPDGERGSTIDCATVFPRVPAHIRRELPKIMKEGMTVDVGYAQRRGRTLALYIMCDGLMVDDMDTAGTRLKTPYDAVTRAIVETTRSAEVRLRCWKLNGGSMMWRELERETREFEQRAGVPRGTIAAMVVDAEKKTEIQWITDEPEFLERLREYGARSENRDAG